ncbi:hypothetical protein WA026_003808 [Henosepilachna vigintioctopunctata]|uniref:Uncharacterized protein n=1 Tax=Henosepilachna vigintioctopunctata TaxID=420089 RepID=A0AAW1UFS1_9CUCU
MVAVNRILDIVNVSLCYGEFPEEWKITTVIPVPKKLKTKKREEFRPIKRKFWNTLDQSWAKYGPRAKCGPRDSLIRPATRF